MNVIVLVAPDGATHIEARGYPGRCCLAATRQLEAALGHKTSDRLTAEFYAVERHAAQRRISAAGGET
jgi:hypothetical protein